MSKEILLWISSYLPSSDLPKGIHWRRKNLNMLLLHVFHVCLCQDNFLRAYCLLIGYRKMLFFISTITHNFSINFYKSNWWICNQQVAMNIPIVNFSDDYVILFIYHSFYCRFLDKRSTNFLTVSTMSIIRLGLYILLYALNLDFADDLC